MIKIYINGREYEVKRGIMIMKAIEESGEGKISKYCYNERMMISGNCRMCLVEVEGVGKPVVSCSEEVRENIKIYTETGMVKKSREGVMEMLLLNHPIDCPICDQGGECDLQEESMRVGTERNRSYKHKRREVKEKSIGRLVKMEMKRCIQCSRCVRYVGSVSGDVGESKMIGMIGRGVEVEVSKYSGEERVKGGNMIGNIVDLCPVGWYSVIDSVIERV